MHVKQFTDKKSYRITYILREIRRFWIIERAVRGVERSVDPQNSVEEHGCNDYNNNSS